MTRCFLTTLLLASISLHGEKFFADDPVQAYPAPQNVENIRARRINEYYDFFQNTFFRSQVSDSHEGPAPARAINTIGEVPDSEWFTNRHGRRRLSLTELQRGPGNSEPPSTAGIWRVASAKAEGITPGFTIVDGEGRRYLLKFDPPSNPELASAADVISSKILYAIGYNVPENYVVRFRSSQLVIDNGSKFVDHYGKARPLTERDLATILAKVRTDADGTIRALASRFIPGSPVGPFRYHGTRPDDPNDTVAHEHRRDLRGLRVFAAWLGHDDAKALNTLDTLVTENGSRFIKHYLIDFGASLGSASYGPNSPRSGNEYLFDWGFASRQFLSLGLWVPKWATARYPKIPAAGAFEYAMFNPEQWVPEYPNAAFANLDPDDAFWAAKQVMAFTDEEIRALVKTGEYSSSAAEEWVTRCLIQRRNKIGRAYFSRVAPLDRFVVRNGQLRFENLAAAYFGHEATFAVQWHTLDNAAGILRAIDGATTLDVPKSEAQYLAAELRDNDRGQNVTVYVRDRHEIVGREDGLPQNVLMTQRYYRSGGAKAVGY